MVANLISEHKKNKYCEFFMNFNENQPHETLKGKNFWTNIAQLIAGPDYEYVCLKQLFQRYKFYSIMELFDNLQKDEDAKYKKKLE